MSKSRKTVKLETILDIANKAIKNSTGSAESRQFLESVLEDILFSAGAYKGFRYLDETEVPYDYKPGINSHPLGIENLTWEEKFNNTDETRRMYF